MKVIIEDAREWHLLNEAFEKDIRLEVLVMEIPTIKAMPALISEGRLLLAISSHKAKKMEWTKDKPTEPGWYWYREHPKLIKRRGLPEFRLMQVVMIGDLFAFYDTGDGRAAWTLWQLPGQWLGPVESLIPPPKKEDLQPPPIGADW